MDYKPYCAGIPGGLDAEQPDQQPALPPSSLGGTVAPEAAFARLARLLEGPATIGVEQMSIVESIHECALPLTLAPPPLEFLHPSPPLYARTHARTHLQVHRGSPLQVRTRSPLQVRAR